jgi:hypothetical protein
MDSKAERGYITHCGVYCGACSHRLTGQEHDPRHMTSKAKQLDPEELKYWTSCPGCGSDNYRADCDFKICATAKNVDRCVDCDQFPCQAHKEFNSDGVPHHAGALASLAVLREKGEEAWLIFQRKKWTCDCGARLSWYLRACVNCGRPAGTTAS